MSTARTLTRCEREAALAAIRSRIAVHDTAGQMATLRGDMVTAEREWILAGIERANLLYGEQAHAEMTAAENLLAVAGSGDLAGREVKRAVEAGDGS